MITKRDVKMMADGLGLSVRMNSPGDGMTRYEFTSVAEGRPLFTVGGAKNAWAWLCAYREGRQAVAKALHAVYLYADFDEARDVKDKAKEMLRACWFDIK